MKKLSYYLYVCVLMFAINPLTAFAYGGGGGSSVLPPSSDSNTATSTISSQVSNTTTGEASYSRPLQLTSDVISVNGETGSKTAQLTGSEGTITLKPNSLSTLSAVIPPDTNIVADSNWDGIISPPILRSNTMINESGEEILNSSNKILRDNVLVVVKAGSTLSPLNFSNNVTMNVPVENTADGTPVIVYFSNDGIKWQYLTNSTVKNGKVVFKTKHFTYFVITTSEIGENAFTVHFAAPKSAEVVKFFDIISHWSETYVNQIVSRGIASGKSALRFAPDDAITRAELTKMAVNAFGYEVPGSVSSKPFTDVHITDWYAPYIQAAKVHGIVVGYGQYFKPDNFINRAEASKMLLEAAGFDIGTDSVSSFSDTESGAWYMKYVNFAKNKGIISGYGDGTFRPDNSITRAEASKIIIKILEQ